MSRRTWGRRWGTLIRNRDAVKELFPRELAVFREWFAEFDADAWNRQFEADATAGRLDRLAERAIADYEAGRATGL
jgi:hypothetical protein